MPLHIFTTSWYLTLFSAEPWPPESTKMIWDRLFCDGCRATLAERRRAASGIEAPCTQCLRHGDPLTLYYACGWGEPAADSSPAAPPPPLGGSSSEPARSCVSATSTAALNAMRCVIDPPRRRHCAAPQPPEFHRCDHTHHSAARRGAGLGWADGR
jgi:hypothetical protein